MEDRSETLNQYVSSLSKELTDPIHQRIVKAFLSGDSPTTAMETELRSVLLEVIADEDKKPDDLRV